MQFDLLFFYDSKNEWEFIYKYLNENYRESRIVLQSPEISRYLTDKGLNVITIDHLFPDYSSLQKEVYFEAKDIQKEFKKIFERIEFRGFQIFPGFEYSFLRELMQLVKIRRILLSEKKNTVVILNNFYFSYFAILNDALRLGYNNSSKVGFINGDKIEYLNHNDERLTSTFSNRFKVMRAKRFLKTSTKGGTWREKLKRLYQFYFRGMSLMTKLVKYKLKSMISSDQENTILDKIQQKIEKTYGQSESDCIFCITAIREDLYLNPWVPIFGRFEKESKKCQIITADLSTSLMLSKQNVPFVNLFEEVNILSDIIKQSKEGKIIHESLEESIRRNSDVVGIFELIPYLLSQSYRCCALVSILDRLLGISNSSSVVCGADGEMLENLLCEVAKKYQVPSFSILPGAVIYRPLFADWFHADKIFVPGTVGMELLKTLDYDTNKIIISGNPKYDHIKKLDKFNSKKLLVNEIGIDVNRKLIVIAMSRWHPNDEIWMSDLISFCNKNNLEVIIKIHPLYKREDNHTSEEKIKTIREKCKGLRFHIGYDYSLTSVLSASDLVITEYSDTGIEAILLGKPLITVNFVKENFDQYINYHKHGAAIYVDKYPDLEKSILETLNDKNEFLSKGREKIVEMYNHANDGKAEDRIFKILKGGS